MTLKKYPYESCFANLRIKPLVAEEKDKYLALASLQEIKQFLPNIDTQKNLDLLPVAFDACVVNRVNKNKDIISTETALAIYKDFIYKPINVEHHRNKVVGVILTAGFSEFGTDKVLTEEEAKASKKPFNITLGGVVWRVVCPDLSDALEEANDETSSNYPSLSASWELGFTGYNIVLLPGGAKNLEQASKIIIDEKEVEELKGKLTSTGGEGKIDDLFAYRMPSCEVIPLGIGFTFNPAAEVKGVITPQNDAIETSASQNDQKSEKIISQLNESHVKTERDINMKITSLKDITDESLKQCTASAVSDFIAAELKKGSDQWTSEKNALDNQLAEAKSATAKITSDYESLQKQMVEVKAALETLNKEKAEKEKVETFNRRMNEISAAYTLDDEVRGAIVDEVKSLPSEEAYATWMKKAQILLKGYAKKAPNASKEEKGKEEKGKEGDKEKKGKEECKASTVVENAIDKGTKEAATIPNGSATAPQSLTEKYKEAFAVKNFQIKL